MTAIRARLEEEIGLVRAVWNTVRFDDQCNCLVIERVDLPNEWTQETTPILVQIPGGYPTTPPDNFGTRPDLSLRNGAQPQNTMGKKTLAGQGWLMFSWHVKARTWRPHSDPITGDNLLTYLRGVQARLAEGA